MVLLGLAVASGKKVPQQDNHNQPHKGKQAEPDTGFINFDVIILQISRWEEKAEKFLRFDKVKNEAFIRNPEEACKGHLIIFWLVIFF